METLNERIKQLRKEKGLTQSQLADALGITDKAVSKWEVGEANPDISLLVKLAEILEVSVDYLLTGKIEEGLSLDDMDAQKRAIYLAKKDDLTNFVKYGYLVPEVLLSVEKLTNFRSERNKLEIRNAIVENQSIKIFGALADALIPEIKRGKYGYTNLPSNAGLFQTYLDDFVKLCALSNKVELLSLIQFKSFAIGDNTSELNSRTDFYKVKEETIQFILSDKRISKDVVEYVGTYEKYGKNTIRYSWYGEYSINFSNAIRMQDTVLAALYKAKRYDMIDKFLEAMKEEAQASVDKAVESANDYCWRSNYSFGEFGYMFYHNGNGSTETTTVEGRVVCIWSIIKAAIENGDKKNALKYNQYNVFIKELLEKLPRYDKKPSPFIIDEKYIDRQFEEQKRQKKYEEIMADESLNEKDRRWKLFDLGGIIRLEEAIRTNDYELFVRFPIEETSKASISTIANHCNDVRFYIFAVNYDPSQDKLNDALVIILERLPERYDILDVLLSAGAQVADNPAMTVMLKQNVLILNNQKANKAADVKIDAKETKEALLKDLDQGKIEHVIVNLAFQLEQKLKAKYGNLPLLNMINMANKEGIISDEDCHQLHNLRKSRNTIMHEGDERGHYTLEVVREWIKVVYKL